MLNAEIALLRTAMQEVKDTYTAGPQVLDPLQNQPAPGDAFVPTAESAAHLANAQRAMRRICALAAIEHPGTRQVHDALSRGDDETYSRYMENIRRKLAEGGDIVVKVQRLRDVATGLVVPAPLTAHRKIKCLLEAELAGVVPARYTFFKDTLLHQAAKTPMPASELQEILSYLLDAGIDVNARDISGSTALHHLSRQQDPSGALLKLVQRGADLDARDGWGHTVAHRLATHGAMGRQLLGVCAEHGADMRATTLWRGNLLHIVLGNMTQDDPSLVADLLRLGVDPHQGDHMGLSPLEYALMRGHRESAALLSP